MTKNMGKMDRSVRIIVAALLVILLLAGVVPAGILQLLALIVAVVFVVTSAIGVCPLYTVLGIRTCPRG